MKKQLLLGVALSALIAVSAHAQFTTLNWNFTDGDAVFDNGAPVNFAVSALTATNTPGFAINSSSPSSGYAGVSGGNNAVVSAASGAFNVNTSTYFSFTLTPSAGYFIHATDFTFGSRSTATGPLSFSLRSSIDNYTTDLGTATALANSTWSLKTLAPFNATGADSTPVTFRLYGFGGSSVASNWRIDDLNFTVEALAIPEPSTYAMIFVGAGLLLGIQRFRQKRS